MGNCLADTVIGAATAVVFVHGGDDLVRCGRRIAVDKGCRRHDLATHTPATLRYLQVEKGLLDGVEGAIGISQALNGANLFAYYTIHWSLARSGRYAIDMDGTGATNARTTADFGAGQIEFVTQYQQQRATIAVVWDGVCFLIDD